MNHDADEEARLERIGDTKTSPPQYQNDESDDESNP